MTSGTGVKTRQDGVLFRIVRRSPFRVLDSNPTVLARIVLVRPLFPEMPGRTKDHHAMAPDEKRLAGLGVAPQTIRSLPEFEHPEPRQLDRLAIQNGLSDLPNDEIESLSNSLPWKIGPSPVVSRVPGDVGSIQGTPPFFPVCFFGHEL